MSYKFIDILYLSDVLFVFNLNFFDPLAIETQIETFNFQKGERMLKNREETYMKQNTY